MSSSGSAPFDVVKVSSIMSEQSEQLTRIGRVLLSIFLKKPNYDGSLALRFPDGFLLWNNYSKLLWLWLYGSRDYPSQGPTGGPPFGLMKQSFGIQALDSIIKLHVCYS